MHSQLKMVVLARLGRFVTPYLQQLLRALARPRFCDPDCSPTAADASNAGSAELRAKCASARRLLAGAAELRLLLPAAAALYDEATEAKDGSAAASSLAICIPPLLEAVAHSVAAAERAAVVGLHARAWRLAAHTLGRREALGPVAAQGGARDVGAVERAAVQLAVGLTLRLNDGLFSPLFNSLVSWAEPPLEQPAGGGGRERADGGQLAPARAWPTLMLARALLERLRGLATVYAARVLPLATAVLAARAGASAASAGTPAAKKRRGASEAGALASAGGGELGALARLAAEVAKLTLAHDLATNSVDARALDALITPLVGCNAAEAVDGAEEERALLAAAIGALAGALGGAGCARLHFELCQLSRDEAAAVRLQAVRALAALYATLGTDGAVHVAEVVPAVAELLEDADETVEAAARAFLKEVATATGEDVATLIKG
ncbi:hypothetical protein T492DRAFT_837948 [Pavlovales sp. CCMP2436]|nr:hypothetical protein T492DRAFT_837948 [Pavlovales sp. CCMP2436]